MSVASRQTIENQQLIADILANVLILKPGEVYYAACVPARLVKNIRMAIRDRNDSGLYDVRPCGTQYNVNVSQSINDDGETMLLTFRKKENHD